MYKINVAVLFGGCSEEHTVSIKSAMELAVNIDTEKYELFCDPDIKRLIFFRINFCRKHHCRFY